MAKKKKKEKKSLLDQVSDSTKNVGLSPEQVAAEVFNKEIQPPALTKQEMGRTVLNLEGLAGRGEGARLKREEEAREKAKEAGEAQVALLPGNVASQLEEINQAEKLLTRQSPILEEPQTLSTPVPEKVSEETEEEIIEEEPEKIEKKKGVSSIPPVLPPTPPKTQLEKTEKDSGGLSSEFKQALSFFLPTAIGALGGALFEGTAGAVAGAEAAASMNKQFQEFKLDQAKLQLQSQQEERLGVSRDRYALKDLFNEETQQTDTYRVNLDTGDKQIVGRRGYAPSYTKDPTTGLMVNRQTGEILSPGGGFKQQGSETFFTKLTPEQKSDFRAQRDAFVKETVEVRNSIAEVGGISDKLVNLAVDNPVASSQLGAQVALIYESGRLTDEDVLRYTRREGVANKITDGVKNFATGTITLSKAEDIKEALRVFKEVLADKLASRAAEKSQHFAQDYGLDAQDVLNALYQRPDKKDMNRLKKNKGGSIAPEVRAAAAEILKERKRLKLMKGRE